MALTTQSSLAIAIFGEACETRAFAHALKLKMNSFIAYCLKNVKINIEKDGEYIDRFVGLIHTLLEDVDAVNQERAESLDESREIALDSCLKLLYESLHSINTLLPIEEFLAICQELLALDTNIQKQALLMIENRVQATKDHIWAKCNADNVLESLGKLLGEDCDIEVKQLALVCLGVMVKKLGENRTEKFYQIFEIITSEKILGSPSLPLSTTGIVTIGVFTSVLKARAIPKVPDFMNRIVAIISNEKLIADAMSLIFSSAFVTLATIIDAIPMFVTAYLSSIISIALQLSSHEFDSMDVHQSINDLLVTIGDRIEYKSIFPIIVQSVALFIEMDRKSMRLLHLTDSLVQKADPIDIIEMRRDWGILYLELFQSKDLSQSAEDRLISSFVKFTMKINEIAFRQIFIQLVEWALNSQESNEKTKLSVYKLLVALLDSLKTIFVPFMYLVASALEQTLESKAAIGEEWFFGLRILKKTFINDTAGNI
jgi:hypothetical protein